jgi:hypothetical protein
MNRLNCLNSLLSLPPDLIEYIKYFLKQKCNKCEVICDEYYLYKNCVIYKYYNIFDDRYFFPREMEEYNNLCINCSKKFKLISNKNSGEKENKYLNYFMDYSPEFI